jgi:TfoX/Sxy family transcriptional regulator of competence genes
MPIPRRAGGVRSRTVAWVKVPPENHPVFLAALPKDPRIETIKMFGGVAARVNGHLFAGLFGRSTMVWLQEPDKAAALALEGAGPFDPMGDGRARSDKVSLPERIMEEPEELRHWIARAFEGAVALPKKVSKQLSKKVSKKESTRESKAGQRMPAGKGSKPSRRRT